MAAILSRPPYVNETILQRKQSYCSNQGLHITNLSQWLVVIGNDHDALLAGMVSHGPLARYVKLRIAHASRMPRTFFPSPTSKENASKRSRHASWHVRDARAVMHVGIVNPLWWGKRPRHSRRMHNPQFYVSVKRSMGHTTARVSRTVLSLLTYRAINNHGCLKILSKITFVSRPFCSSNMSVENGISAEIRIVLQYISWAPATACPGT